MITSLEEKQEATNAYKPELLVETESGVNIDSREEYQEIVKYSITPTSFKSRELTNPVRYKDTFKYKDNEVIRYGINAKHLTLDDITNENIELCSSDATMRSSSKYKQEDAQEVIHHSLEKELLQEAVNHLLDNPNCKTVLVDIFARVSGQVKTKDEYLETHTIVLYKNPTNSNQYSDPREITVIDPSSFLFSSHLSAPNMETSHDLLEKITTIHKNLQIYIPLPNSTGPNHQEYRDCIDIAVKIAFGLNKMAWTTINSETAI